MLMPTWDHVVVFANLTGAIFTALATGMEAHEDHRWSALAYLMAFVVCCANLTGYIVR